MSIANSNRLSNSQAADPDWLATIRHIIDESNAISDDMHITIETVEAVVNSITIKTITDDGHMNLTATVKHLGDFTFKVNGVTITSTILGVWIHGSTSWQIIDTHVTSLFALFHCYRFLYACADETDI